MSCSVFADAICFILQMTQGSGLQSNSSGVLSGTPGVCFEVIHLDELQQVKGQSLYAAIKEEFLRQDSPPPHTHTQTPKKIKKDKDPSK